ncbi:unnamed protein product [Orchesella dallaii]|uniref:Odorant receptor n=1 Tax=Orchesella dallaii TaxID=48710 RepID=A0ABP1RJF2_9HEXA
MLTPSCMLPALKLGLRIARCFGGVRIEWDKERKLIAPISSPKRLLFHHTCCRIQIFLCTLVLIQTYQKRHEDSMTIFMINAFPVVYMSYCHILTLTYSLKYRIVIQLLNNMIGFSNKYSEQWKNSSKLDTIEKFAMWTHRFFVYSITPFPFLYPNSVVRFLPCLAANPGYWILNECSGLEPSSSGIESGKKILVYLANYFLWAFGLHSAIFVFGTMTAAATCLRSFLKTYLIEYKNTLHGKKRSNRKFPQQMKVAILYRQIQVMVNMFNDIHQKVMMSSTVLELILLQIVTFYMVIETEYSLSNLPYILLFGCIFVNAFIATLCLFGVMGSVYTDSVRILKGLKANEKILWLKKFHLSCAPVKLQFGQNNFVEKVTALNCEDFFVKQSVNLLLVE